MSVPALLWAGLDGYVRYNPGYAWVVVAPIGFPSTDAAVWRRVGWIAVGGTVLPFMMSLSALRVADPGRVGVLQSLEPAVAASSAWLLLGQTLGPSQIMGGLIVICSIAAIQHLTSNVAPDAPSPHPI
jgi:threonine/homoserine efflux transporter RhtA